jgi:hypothetical protein
VIWVLSLTLTALVGGILWQAERQCPHPCTMDAPQAIMGQRPLFR